MAIDPSQLANLVILPPRDFSGDMNLVLEAITQEIGTTEIRYTESEFTVGVNPIGDKVEFFDLPEQLTGSEDDGIVIPLDANSFETNSDEFLAITVTVNGTSDPSGLVGLDRIRIDQKPVLSPVLVASYRRRSSLKQVLLMNSNSLRAMRLVTSILRLPAERSIKTRYLVSQWSTRVTRARKT